MCTACLLLGRSHKRRRQTSSSWRSCRAQAQIVTVILKSACSPRGVALVLSGDPPASATFNSKQGEMLVDWFNNRPFFYNQRLPDFKNHLKRERLLEQVGFQLSLPAPSIFTWFYNMQIMSGNIVKQRKSGQVDKLFTSQQQWTLRSLLSWTLAWGSNQRARSSDK